MSKPQGIEAATPRLRFPEFSGEWEEKRLGDVFNWITTNSLSRASLTNDVGSLQNIHYGDIHTRYPILLDQAIEQIPFVRDCLPFSSLKPEYFCRVGDVVFADASEDYADVGKAIEIVNVREKSLLSGLHTLLARPIKEPTIIGFFGQFFASPYVRKQIKKIAQGISVLGVSKVRLEKIILHIPHPDEQEKIAGFLGAVDRRIEGLKARQDALNDYKKGVMQQIFSQQLRFTKPDSSPFPNWQEKRLGDVFNWITTNSLSRASLTNDVGSLQNIHYGDIHTRYPILLDQAIEQIPFVRDCLPFSSLKPEYFCRVGDVVFADASEDYADVGKAIEIVNVREKSLLSGLHTLLARPIKEPTIIGFFGQFFASPYVRKQIKKIAQGISVLGVSKVRLEKIILHIPHPDEQKKIADFLSAIDRRIDATTDKITETSAYKKALLQQMFI